MSGWNWRLYKDTVLDSKGKEVERIRFVEAWYDRDGKVNGLGDNSPTLEQFGEVKEQDNKDFSFDKIEYSPISDDTAVSEIRFTLEKLMEALDKPVLTKDDISGL